MSTEGEYVFVLYKIFKLIFDNYFIDDLYEKYPEFMKYFEETFEMLKKDNYILNKEFLNLE